MEATKAKSNSHLIAARSAASPPRSGSTSGHENLAAFATFSLNPPEGPPFPVARSSAGELGFEDHPIVGVLGFPMEVEMARVGILTSRGEGDEGDEGDGTRRGHLQHVNRWVHMGRRHCRRARLL